MRLTRILCLVGLALSLAAAAASAASAAGPGAHIRQLAPPTHADLILARTGVGRWPHAGERTVASTQQGTVVWLNNGVGAFSALPLEWTGPTIHASPLSWIAAVIVTLTPLDRTEPGVTSAAMTGIVHRGVVGGVMPPSMPGSPAQLSSASSPRAPPRHRLNVVSIF